MIYQDGQMPSQIEIYQTASGETRIEVRFVQDTLWLSQLQMADLFGKDVRTINEHVKNIFADKELPKKATIRKFRMVRQEGQRQVQRDIEHYNLDMAISVGYRVNSRKGTQFRIWATQRLKEHLVRGYTLNQTRFDKNAAELKQALALIEKAAQSTELSGDAGRGLVDIVSRYTQTFLWLQRYDEGLLEKKGFLYHHGETLDRNPAQADVRKIRASASQSGCIFPTATYKRYLQVHRNILGDTIIRKSRIVGTPAFKLNEATR